MATPRRQPRARPLLGGAVALAVAIGVTQPASAIVWRDNLTDQQVRDLGQQGQFAGVALRAGTNLIDRQANIFTGTNSPIYDNDNQAAGSTVFEATTAPGDSGGPMFLQENNQWFLGRTIFGVIPNAPVNGFVNSNAASDFQWILDTTGLTFTPQAGPTEIVWDADPATNGVQTGPGRWHTQRPNFTANPPRTLTKIGGGTAVFDRVRRVWGVGPRALDSSARGVVETPAVR